MGETLYLAGSIIAGFLCLLVLVKKGKELADYLLIAWMGLSSIHTLLYYLQSSEILYQYPWLVGISLPLPALHGTMLYLYTLSITQPQRLKKPQSLLHFIPFAILLLAAVPFFLLPSDEKITVFKNDGQSFEWYLIIQFVVISSSGFFYAMLSILAVRKYRKTILDSYSNTDKIMLNWLEKLAMAIGALWVLVLFFDDPIIFTGVMFFILFIGVFGINQAPIFQSKNQSATPETQSISTPPKNQTYARSGLSEVDIDNIMARLDQLMIDQAPYKKSDLTLRELSDALDIAPAHLSQAINTKWKENFYDYINTHRINEFLRLATLPESKKFTFLALAFECGFNSKTTFNKYFKAKTGQTPSEYLKQ